MYCVNDFNERFVNTYDKICKSSLLQKVESINVVAVGDNKEKAKDLFKFFEKVNIRTGTNNGSESDTLKLLWNTCQKEDINVLYLHSKGVTKPNFNNVKDWANLMEYFLIEKHEQCLEALETHDVCGVNYFNTKPHYSGNFWWATSKHIKRLKELKVEKIDRLYCEYWLFDIDAVIKRKEIYNSGINHYYEPFPRQRYAIEK